MGAARDHDGRDVFVSGLDSVDEVKAAFAAAFSLGQDQMYVEGEAQDAYLDALSRGDVISIYTLDPRGDFPFKVDMEFASRIDESRFLDAARGPRVAIAYSVDENSDDFDYYIATRHGIARRRLSFHDVDDDNYICNLVR